MNTKLEQKERNEVNLKEADVSDIPKLIEVEQSVSSKTYLALLDEEKWKIELQKHKVYLINDDNNIVGDLSYQVRNKDTIYISGLAIIPAFQGKGIGRKAMTKLMQELQSVNRVELVTHPNNARAIALYESLGFVIESRSENHYGDGEPRLILARVNKTS